jgi:hypothetical protein
MADPVTAGIAAVGTGVQIYSQIKAGNDKADAARADAANKRLQATEVIRAGEREQDLLRIRGEKYKGNVAQAYAASGVELQGTPLLQLEDTAKQITSESIALEHATQFRADQLRRGADLEEQQAGNYLDEGLLGALGSGLQGAGRAYALADPNNKRVQRIGAL